MPEVLSPSRSGEPMLTDREIDIIVEAIEAGRPVEITMSEFLPALPEEMQRIEDIAQKLREHGVQVVIY